jgi:hypothetical protein
MNDELESMWKEAVMAYFSFAWTGYRKPQNFSL